MHLLAIHVTGHRPTRYCQQLLRLPLEIGVHVIVTILRSMHLLHSIMSAAIDTLYCQQLLTSPSFSSI